MNDRVRPLLFALRRLASPLLVALAAVLPAGSAVAAPELCVVIASPPQQQPLAMIKLDAGEPVFTITWVHPATRTPVEEAYRVDDDGITETSIEFAERAPGLPSEVETGETWTRADGRYKVTMARRFSGIRMQVDSAQQPALYAAGKSTALAQWGNRALALFAAQCEAKKP